MFVHGMSFVGGDTTLERIGIIFVVAVVFGLVNAFIKPIVQILSIPLYILTLGLFHIVVNALMLWITAWITEHTTHWGLQIRPFLVDGDLGRDRVVDRELAAVAGGRIVALAPAGDSARLPPRRSLLGEGARSFLSVLGRENAVAVQGFVVIGRLQIKRQTFDSRLFCRRHGERRVGRDALGVVIGGVHQLSAGTTWLISPIARARSASTMSAVSNSSIANA